MGSSPGSSHLIESLSYSSLPITTCCLFLWPVLMLGEAREVPGCSRGQLTSCDEHPFLHWLANVLWMQVYRRWFRRHKRLGFDPWVGKSSGHGSRGLATTLTSGLVFAIFSDVKDDLKKELAHSATV